MFPRYCFVLFVVFALFVFTTKVSAQEAAQDDDTQTRAIPFLGALLKALGVSALNCVGELADKCKDQISDFGKLVECAKNFVTENKGICLVSR